MAGFTLTARIDAPIGIVFEVLTDHRGYTRFSPVVRRVVLEQEGDPAPNGVGAIRRFPVIGPPVREQVTEYIVPTRFAYRILSGVPVLEHTGVVDLVEHAGATLMTYRVETTPRLPGLLGSGLTSFLRFAVGQIVVGVRKVAERHARSGV